MNNSTMDFYRDALTFSQGQGYKFPKILEDRLLIAGLASLKRGSWNNILERLLQNEHLHASTIAAISKVEDAEIRAQWLRHPQVSQAQSLEALAKEKRIGPLDTALRFCDLGEAKFKEFLGEKKFFLSMLKNPHLPKSVARELITNIGRELTDGVITDVYAMFKDKTEYYDDLFRHASAPALFAALGNAPVDKDVYTQSCKTILKAAKKLNPDEGFVIGRLKTVGDKDATLKVISAIEALGRNVTKDKADIDILLEAVEVIKNCKFSFGKAQLKRAKEAVIADGVAFEAPSKRLAYTPTVKTTPVVVLDINPDNFDKLLAAKLVVPGWESRNRAMPICLALVHVFGEDEAKWQTFESLYSKDFEGTLQDMIDLCNAI